MDNAEDTSVVVKAHSCVTKAEEARASGQWETAIDYYQKAAELFLVATNHTSDIESIKALRLLSSSQTNKASEIQRQIQHFNKTKSPPPSVNNSNAPRSSNVNFSVNQPTTNVSVNIGPSESFLSPLEGSVNYFVGQSPSGSDSMNEILLFQPQGVNRTSGSVATIPVQNLENSLDGEERIDEIPLHESYLQEPSFATTSETVQEPNLSYDLWHWMEQMLNILPKPIVQSINNVAAGLQQQQYPKSTAQDGPPVDGSTIMNSFFLVNPATSSPPQTAPLVTPPERRRTTGSFADGPAPDLLKTDSAQYQMKKMEMEIAQLKETINKLKVENNNLRSAYQQNLQVSKENNILKQSIVTFRNEIQKKANQLRQSPNLGRSVGNLPVLLQQLSQQTTSQSKSPSPIVSSKSSLDHTYSPKNRELEVRVTELTERVKQLTEKCAQQDLLIEKYEKRWESLQEEARRRRKEKYSNNNSSSTTGSIIIGDSVSLADLSLASIIGTSPPTTDRTSNRLDRGDKYSVSPPNDIVGSSHSGSKIYGSSPSPSEGLIASSPPVRLVSPHSHSHAPTLDLSGSPADRAKFNRESTDF